MAIPLIQHGTIFDNIAASDTGKELQATFSHAYQGQTLLLEVVGASTPNWTLDIQGKTHPDGTYTQVDYMRVWLGGAADLTNAALTVDFTAARFYLVPNLPPFLRLVATRTAGNLTVRASLTTEPYTQFLLTTSRGSVFAEGPVASDAVAAGNPVQMGGVVDDTAPAAAAEADARAFRSTPEGNQTVEIYRDNISALFLDDVAWTVATNPVFPIAALADETSPDSVDEGDVGAVAMTLARELIVTMKKRGAGATTLLFFGGTVNSAARETMLTPTVGKAIRVISIQPWLNGVAVDGFEAYFGVGAGIGTNTGKAVSRGYADDSHGQDAVVWPDGVGPLGAVDDVFSVRKNTAVANESLTWILEYREE